MQNGQSNGQRDPLSIDPQAMVQELINQIAGMVGEIAGLRVALTQVTRERDALAAARAKESVRQ
jgi:hypothetical protein